MTDKIATIIIVIILLVVLVVGAVMFWQMEQERGDAALKFCQSQGWNHTYWIGSEVVIGYGSIFCFNHTINYLGYIPLEDGKEVCMDYSNISCLCPSQVVAWFTGCGCPPINITARWC